MLEYGIWAWDVPFFSLPPEEGAQLLEILRLNVPTRFFHLREIRDTMKSAWGASGAEF